MAERITPPTKAVARKDGIKDGAEGNISSPSHKNFGKYQGPGESAASVKPSSSMFGK